MAPSRYDWKIVDWDVKPQHNQPTNTRTVRQSTDELRDQYENSSAHFGRRVVVSFLNRLKIS